MGLYEENLYITVELFENSYKVIIPFYKQFRIVIKNSHIL